MDTDDRGYAQPFDFVSASALTLAVEDVRVELETLRAFVQNVRADADLAATLSSFLENATVANALTLIDRAAAGLLTRREEPTLLKYVVNANMILRARYAHADNTLAELLFDLERRLITRMALSFSSC